MATTAPERREIFFSGRVQGVGFRYTVHSLARRFPVSGYVKNLPDGQVQVIVEGTGEQVQAFLKEIHAAMGAYIRNVSENSGPASGRYQGFEVRY